MAVTQNRGAETGTFRLSRSVIVWAIAALVFLSVGCGGPEERKAKYRMKAQDYMQAGNFPKARVALRNVLKSMRRMRRPIFCTRKWRKRKRTGATRSATISRSSTCSRSMKGRW